MSSELKNILHELVHEFEVNKSQILTNPKLSYCITMGEYPTETSNKNGATLMRGTCFNFNLLVQILGVSISKFESYRKIYEYGKQKEDQFKLHKSFEESEAWCPSITCKIAAGFLARNFELNDFQFRITKQSFDLAFNELDSFFAKHHVEGDIYVFLNGLTGNIDEIELSENVSIIKADYGIVKAFCLHYSTGVLHGDNLMYTGDYVLKIKNQILKSRLANLSGKAYKDERDLIEKWSYVPMLGTIGRLEVGKCMRFSQDWATYNTGPGGPFGRKINFYSFKNDKLSVTYKETEHIRAIADIIKNAEFNVLDKKIIYALERLKKSKMATTIDDRVLDLAISFEYAINTDKRDIILDLCLKAIKLLNECNHDEEVYKKLKKFYGLRSKIVHGDGKVELTAVNIDIIDSTENAVQNILIRLIDLNKLYPMKTIQDVLTKSLYIAKPLNQLLEELTLPNN